MNRRNTLKATRLRKLLSYDPVTGIFIRLIQTSNRIKVGDVAGGKNALGYIQISVDGEMLLGHRLAWLYMTGKWPASLIDHKNMIRHDNRWCNIREATKSLNMQNQRQPSSRNLAGFLGVSTRRYGFSAHIQIEKKIIYLGTYRTAERAHQAYVEGKRKHHPGGML